MFKQLYVTLMERASLVISHGTVYENFHNLDLEKALSEQWNWDFQLA